MKKLFSQHQKGFALLFTILVITLALNIAVGISTISYKQTILSTLARDSQVAFYQADAGVECGLYYDLTKNAFPKGVVIGSDNIPRDSNGNAVPVAINCGDSVLDMDFTDTKNDYLVFSSRNIATSSQACFEVIFDKTDTATSFVRSNGYNQCAFGPRQVERTLEVQY